MMRLGGPVFVDTQDPVELAKAHRKLGYGAAYCPSIDIEDEDRIRAIREAYAKENVIIAEVGAWCNMMDPDETKRRENLERVCKHMALADEVGACCCVNIAGSFNPDSWYGPHPKNLSQDAFDLAVENVRHVVDSVKPKRSAFSIETMPWAVPDCAESYLKLIRAVDRPAFKVHLDPINLVNCPERYYSTGDLLDECFDKLGPWIVSCHAKDIHMGDELTMYIKEVCIGAGVFDFRRYLTRLSQQETDIPLMIEHMHGEEEYTVARQHVQKVAGELGLTFN
ncbi:MAG: TIM barrel protein [bacterium]